MTPAPHSVWLDGWLAPLSLEVRGRRNLELARRRKLNGQQLEPVLYGDEPPRAPDAVGDVPRLQLNRFEDLRAPTEFNGVGAECLHRSETEILAVSSK